MRYKNMITTDLQNNKIEILLARLANRKEKNMGTKAHGEGFYSISEKEDYEVVYMHYGYAGAGYYYTKLL